LTTFVLVWLRRIVGQSLVKNGGFFELPRTTEKGSVKDEPAPTATRWRVGHGETNSRLQAEYLVCADQDFSAEAANLENTLLSRCKTLIAHPQIRNLVRTIALGELNNISGHLGFDLRNDPSVYWAAIHRAIGGQFSFKVRAPMKSPIWPPGTVF
jgi:hypothetical protein